MSKLLERLTRYNSEHERFEDKVGILYMHMGKPIIGKLVDRFPSSLCGGLPRSGKTNAACMWAATIVMAGGQLIIIDPHCNAPCDSLARTLEPLAPWYACQPIDWQDTDAVTAQFQWLYDELQARKAPNGCEGKRFLFAIVDEWQQLLDSFDKQQREIVLRAVKAVCREGRKFGMFCCLISHTWNLEGTGGADIRKSVTGRVAFNCELADQRLILQTSDNRTLAMLNRPPLRAGEGIIRNSMGRLQRVKFIRTTRAGCEYIAEIVAAINPPTGDIQTQPFSAHSAIIQQPSLDIAERTPEAVAAEVRRLHSLGWGKQRTIMEVWHAKSGGSRAYKRAEEEYHMILGNE